jgi:hypothetical protein
MHRTYGGTFHATKGTGVLPKRYAPLSELSTLRALLLASEMPRIGLQQSAFGGMSVESEGCELVHTSLHRLRLFERVQNGERGLFVTVTEIDLVTGEVSTRRFGRSFTIPTADRPTIALDVTIATRP